MKNYKYIGLSNNRLEACILTSNLSFEDLKKKSLKNSDFNHDCTNWEGRDDLCRTLELSNLRLTNNMLELTEPLVFKGEDPDMGHVYKWSFKVKYIIEAKRKYNKSDYEH